MNDRNGRNGTASSVTFTFNGTLDTAVEVVPAPRAASPRAAEALPAAARGPLLAVIAPDAPERDIHVLVDGLRLRGIEASVFDVGPGVVMLPDAPLAEAEAVLRAHPGIAHVGSPDSPYRLARREVVPEGSVVAIGGVAFGRGAFGVIAGPCAVESRAQILAAARAVVEAGAGVLRGGAFKPRTSPYAFQGLGLPGIDLLVEARAATGLPFVTEVTDASQVEALYPHVDAFQVGARNMQNYELLKVIGDGDKPVLLKRGPSATLEEWLLAAEYVLAGGNPRVILCERGIRTFNRGTRYTLDLATMALARRETHLPVIVDPSHATGDPDLVLPMARAALAAGADGVIVEVHPAPAEALSDGAQALVPAQLHAMVAELEALAPVLGRALSRPHRA